VPLYRLTDSQHHRRWRQSSFWTGLWEWDK